MERAQCVAIKAPQLDSKNAKKRLSKEETRYRRRSQLDCWCDMRISGWQPRQKSSVPDDETCKAENEMENPNVSKSSIDNETRARSEVENINSQQDERLFDKNQEPYAK